jgi:hypothetical protein
MIKNLTFEVLDPAELGDDWDTQTIPAIKPNALKLHIHDGEMNLLASSIKKYQPKKFFDSLTDNRYIGTIEEVQKAKANKDDIMHIAQILHRYDNNRIKLEEIEKLEKRKKEDEEYLCGYNLSNFVTGLQKYVTRIVERFNENHPDQSIDIEVPEFKLEKRTGFDVVEFSASHIDVVHMYMKDEFNAIKSLKEFKSWLLDQRLEIEDDARRIHLNLEQVSEEHLKWLSALHASHEIDNTISQVSSLVFLTEEKGVHFAFISVAESQLDQFEKIVAEHCHSAQEINWNKEVLLWQSKGSLNGFQSIAQSVGTIDSKEVDPTGVIAVFFSIFFAFCLADAVYGLFLALFCGYFLFFRELKPGLVNIFRLFAVSGLATVVFGVLTNSFAGDLASYLGFGGVLENVQLINILDPNANVPVNNFLRENGGTSPIVVLLGTAVLIGVLNLVTAYIIKVISGARSEEKEGLGSDIAWLVFVFSVFGLIPGFIVTSLFLPSIIFFVIGTAGLFIFNSSKGIVGKAIAGLGSMYGLISLGADILSYTRLVAVGLTGGIIANVINLLADLIYTSISWPVVAVIAGIIVLLLGHAFNLVISLFGAYINPLRLHYVEFLPKFYEGKGRQFKPTSRELTYFRTSGASA